MSPNLGQDVCIQRFEITLKHEVIHIFKWNLRLQDEKKFLYYFYAIRENPIEGSYKYFYATIGILIGFETHCR